MILSVRLLVTLVAATCLFAAACGGTSEEPAGPAAESEAAPTPAAVADAAEPETQSAFSWAQPDAFDATFGAGSRALVLSAMLPEVEGLPPEWQMIDIPNEDEDESCLGVEPLAALEAAWLVPPADEAVAVPNIVIVGFEDHGDQESAERAGAFFGTPEWVTCQEASLNDGTSEAGVRIESDDPEGESIVSSIDRPGIEARRQVTTTSVFGSEFELVAETHVWNQGSVLVAVSVVSADESHVELAQIISANLESGDASWTPEERQILDERVPTLRRSIERDESQLPFFVMQRRTLFHPQVPQPFQDCATASAGPVLTVMNGPIWATATGASLLIQGGQLFASAEDAVAEVERYESVAETCLIERSQPLLGDIEVDRINVDRVMVDGVEVLFADADITQLASNPFVPTDVAAVAQRAMAVSGSEVVGFGFVGIAGDEPDLLALTAAAVERMGGS